MYAAQTGDAGLVLVLLEKGAEINRASVTGRTPLIEAVSNSHREIVDLLIEKGADLNPFLYKGKVPTLGAGATLLCYSKIRKTRLRTGSAVQLSSHSDEPEQIEAELITATPLEAALQAGQNEIFHHLLENRYTVADNQSGLDEALRNVIQVRNIQVESVALLLEKKANVNSRSFDGSTPLMYAVQTGKRELIALLLDAGAEINVVNSRGGTPLIHGVRKGDLETVTLLLDRGAVATPLSYETKRPYHEIVKRTAMVTGKSGVGKGVVPVKYNPLNVVYDNNSVTVIKQTQELFPLTVHQNSAAGDKREQIALLLLERSSLTPKLIHGTFPRVLKNGWFILADKLIELGADVNMELITGVPLINGLVGNYSFGWKKKEETLNYLCDRGVDANRIESNNTGFSSLHNAAKRSDVNMAARLLKCGADINGLSRPVQSTTVSQPGQTPLVVACTKNHREMIGFLLEQGADIAAVNTAKSPLFHKAKLADPETMALLLAHGADPNVVNGKKRTPLMKAVGNKQNTETIRLLLEYDADPNYQFAEKNAYGPDTLFSPLKMAVSEGNLVVAQLLVQYGADIRSDSMQGMVLQAMVKKKDEQVRFLVRLSAEVNEVSPYFGKNGTSPLMFAAEKGKNTLLRLLLDNGAQTELSDKAGNTALARAVVAGHQENVCTLLQHGANPSAVNTAGLTPYWLTRVGGREEIADYLAANGAETDSHAAFIKRVEELRANSLLPPRLDIKEITPRNLKHYLDVLRQQGISEPDSYQPDLRLATPEKTRELHKAAMLNNDGDLFRKTLSRSDHPLAEIFALLDPAKRKKIAAEIRPTERISMEKNRAQYRIKREMEGEEITFYIYFVKILGEWKIEDY